MTYTLHVKNRYESWTLSPNCPNDNDNQTLPFHPLSRGYFDGTVLSTDFNVVVESPMKNALIPAVLIPTKTYGHTSNGKKMCYKNQLAKGIAKQSKKERSSFYYKCVPNQTSYPIFLVPYEIKHVGFSKQLPNIYVLIRFQSFSPDNNGTVYGQIDQTIGHVDEFAPICEYELYCKNLVVSLKEFKTAITIQIAKEKSSQCATAWTIESSSTPRYAFTIDPLNCRDFDDAFSIDETAVYVHIANVPKILDTFNLWSYLTTRVSTIYFPDGTNKPMLPEILSTKLCSLNTEGLKRVITMKYEIDTGIITFDFNAVIQVRKNHVYDSAELLKDKEYKRLATITEHLTRITHDCPYQDSGSPDTLDCPYQDSGSPVKLDYLQGLNCHTIVEYWMVKMNHEIAKRYSGIIYRICSVKSCPVQGEKGVQGDQCDDTYISSYSLTCTYGHQALQMDTYCHFTSPIRRLVDVLNMIVVQKDSLSVEANQFAQRWMDKIDVLQEQSVVLRRLQNKLNLLYLCLNNHDVLEKTYTGVIISGVYDNGIHNCLVYIGELHYYGQCTCANTNDIEGYKIVLFMDERNFRQKIRLHAVKKEQVVVIQQAKQAPVFQMDDCEFPAL